MTSFSKSGSRFDVIPSENIDVREKLPVGTYTIKADPRTGAFFLVKIADMETRGKIYGDASQTAERILNTFNDRKASTGVMLNGEKGSGKTLLAKLLAVNAAKQGIPTIVINEPWCGEEFNSFIQLIEQPAVIIFDEFEKTYNAEDQEKMLTLLDGVYASKKLFVLTCNDKYRVNQHMKNRPGRIFYRFDYTGLAQEFIIEYCTDNLENKEHIQSVARASTLYSAFNFDMLKAMVEEMNRYGETAQQVMQFLNAKPEANDAQSYIVRLVRNGVEVPKKDLEYGGMWAGNPLMMPKIYIEVFKPKKGKKKDDVAPTFLDDDGDRRTVSVVFENQNLRAIDGETGVLHYVNAAGDELYLTKQVKATINYSDYAF